MKTAFRMVLSTLIAAVILWLLYAGHGWYMAESMLGPTVDEVIDLCFKLLAGVCLLLYVYEWLCLGLDAYRTHRRIKAGGKAHDAMKQNGVQLNISEPQAPVLYDAQAEEELPEQK